MEYYFLITNFTILIGSDSTQICLSIGLFLRGPVGFDSRKHWRVKHLLWNQTKPNSAFSLSVCVGVNTPPPPPYGWFILVIGLVLYGNGRHDLAALLCLLSATPIKAFSHTDNTFLLHICCLSAGPSDVS